MHFLLHKYSYLLRRVAKEKYSSILKRILDFECAPEKELLASQHIEQCLMSTFVNNVTRCQKWKLQIMSEYKNFKKCKYCRAWMVFAICDSCCSIHNTRIRGRPSTPCLCDLFDKLF